MTGASWWGTCVASLTGGLTGSFPNLDADAVSEIVDTDLTDAQINAFLNMAYYRTRPLSGQLSDCGGSGAEEGIIKLLAAHFVKVNEGDVKSEWVGREWKVEYRGEGGMGLNATIYGQQAIAMDCSGKLASAGLKKAGIYVVDTDRAEEHDIVVDT